MQLDLSVPPTNAFKGFLFNCGPYIVRLVPCGDEYRVIETVGADLCCISDEVFSNLIQAQQAWSGLVTETVINELTFSSYSGGQQDEISAADAVASIRSTSH